MAFLEAKNIGIMFGGLKAVENFSLNINEKEIVGLIGPNGAGKTTTFNMLTGVYIPTNGDIVINGESVVGLKPHQIVNRGIARTFQNIRLFDDLTVLENVKIAFQKQMKYSIAEGILRLPRYWKEEKEIDLKGKELLKIFEMEDLAYETAKNLPYGKQRKLEIARALATDPKVLMLDEPAAGMNPQETMELMNTIHFIRDKFDTAILLIEHDMNLVMGICERLIVLNYGVILAEGTPDEIKNNKEVIKAYLGE
ncbi:high-affinity branched-chain amino acid ABC transporter ATP-binding protein LivG [Gottschalkia acidurici 9a]|uniref:High-affinity branched-chain amino acid ABC transporter ATP-binding protein LivG n=1 Tax=Gottschalkia acidurici (strain ATCC 7906 / DSM 604 / BCRC 14475 / CIP 104303 / KCTC 5404 / NCIMB 10678 / 9a) TaxID=1128398 RepID=K0AWH4_GOTA9|nr:ABC transporter ATP-binding protein [Gottschalkia acidurici]AFS78188.1 high-affinity branched-chain amino acid ABC transporter ATP-binding protein LivG [Gottschalkia acidurici 9a]